MLNAQDNLEVDASPSKDYFLNMITKDVSVESCILDLIDNSIDSYKRNRESIKEGIIDIGFDLDGDYFYINDNCGGMTKEIAKNTAFVFGNTTSRYSKTLGMYGIGMKRSIYKIGDNFRVISRTENDFFKVYMEKKEWINLKDNAWKYHLDDISVDETLDQIDENIKGCKGVHIYINELSSSLRNYLYLKKNITDLKNKISNSYKDVLSKAITIRVNGEKIEYVPENLLESEVLNLRSYIKSINEGNVKIKIIAGVGTPFPKLAGWTIIANGRAIIENNKEDLTGWKTDYNAEEEEIDENMEEFKGVMPAYHNDFARFRGYVFLDSEDANELPLNTTKDGIDNQHQIYITILREMRKAMAVLLPNLRKLQASIRQCKEEGKQTPDTVLVPVSFEKINDIENQNFSLNLESYKADDTFKKVPVSFKVSTINELKHYFDVTTNVDLGKCLRDFVLGRIDVDE